MSTFLVRAQEPTISGAFGMNLGGQFDPAKALEVVELDDTENMYKFPPVSSYPGITDYFVLVTPTSHQVYAIIARGTYKDKDQAQKEFPVLIEAVKRKYPAFVRKTTTAIGSPIPQQDSGGFYPGEIEKSWELGGQCTKLSESGDRFIFSWLFCNGKFMGAGNFMVGYVDNRLKAASKEELQKLKTAELESRRKNAGASGL